MIESTIKAGYLPMQALSFRVCLICLVCLVCLGANAPHATGTEPLAKTEILQAVRARNPDADLPCDVLADIGGGRIPVLYWKRDGRYAEPHLAIVKRAADSKVLSVESDLKLPTQEEPFVDMGGEPKWGVTIVKDWDGDGKPELVVVYGYDGSIEAGVGFTSYRNLAVVNLTDALSLSLGVVLDQYPQAETLLRIDSTWKFVSGPDGNPTLQMKVKKELYDARKDKRISRTSVVTYVWKATVDRFVKR